MHYGAHFAEWFKAAKFYGWEIGAPALAFEQLCRARNTEIARLNGIYLQMLERAGVRLFPNRAHILPRRDGDGDAFVLRVGEEEVTTRRVLAMQEDEVIFEMSASFHQLEDGRDYQLGLAADVPEPEDSPGRTLFMPESMRARMPMEMREVGPSAPDEHGWYPSTRRAWMRIKRPIAHHPSGR